MGSMINYLGLQIAQSRSSRWSALGLQIGVIYILGAPEMSLAFWSQIHNSARVPCATDMPRSDVGGILLAYIYCYPSGNPGKGLLRSPLERNLAFFVK